LLDFDTVPPLICRLLYVVASYVNDTNTPDRMVFTAESYFALSTYLNGLSSSSRRLKLSRKMSSPLLKLITLNC
jgi:hypothetical protein